MPYYLSPTERLAALETKVADMNEQIKSIDTKLDTLIDLRNKGAGIFWLITAVFSTGAVGLMTWLFKGH